MPKAWDAEELEMWWDRFHGLPVRSVATLEEHEQLAAEADEAEGLVLLEVKPKRVPQRWHLVVGMVLAILAALAYAEFILWLPKVGRLFQ